MYVSATIHTVTTTSSEFMREVSHHLDALNISDMVFLRQGKGECAYKKGIRARMAVEDQ